MTASDEAPMPTIGLRVFSATRARDRDMLGDVITNWIRLHPHYNLVDNLVDKLVLQSSDAEFHCLTIVIFYDYLGSPA